MKKIIWTSLIFILGILFSNGIYSQTSENVLSSNIYIIRNGKNAGCRTDVFFQNQRQFNLSVNTIVKYKIYSEGEINVTLEKYCSGSNSSKSSSSQLSLFLARGEELYVLYNGVSFEKIEKLDAQKYFDKLENIQKQEESIDYPINKESLKTLNKKEEENQSQGTCFLISSEGYLITNYHCIQNANTITIKGIENDFTTKYQATVIATDEVNDLALLKLKNKHLKFNILPFGIRSTGVLQAEKIYALGFPLAEAMGEEIKITEGIISAKSGVKGDISKLQISAAVNPGNSGGPLIDDNGNLIGVIYAKSTLAESAGYAIKASYLEAFLKNIEDFNYVQPINILKEKLLPEKIKELKNFIFIIETE